MRISCLAITEGRPEFAEWLCWQYLKQDYQDREFILVASAKDGKLIKFVRERIPGAIIETTVDGTWVPVKRNIAMHLATGDAITWFDDDDWRSHEHLTFVAELYKGHQAVIPSGTGLYYFDLKRWMAKHFKCGAWSWGLYDRDLALSIPFNEKQRRATDTKWYGEIKTKLARDPSLAFTERAMSGHCMAVSHRKNISNPQWVASKMTHKYDFSHVMERLVLAPGEREVIAEHLARIKKRQEITR